MPTLYVEAIEEFRHRGQLQEECECDGHQYVEVAAGWLTKRIWRCNHCGTLFNEVKPGDTLGRAK